MRRTCAEIAALLDQWIEETVHARLARWILEDRALQEHSTGCEPITPQRQLPFEVPLTPEVTALRMTGPLKPAVPLR